MMGPKEQLTVTAGNITTYIYSLWPYCCSSTILLDFGFSVGSRITSCLACTAFRLYFPSIPTQTHNYTTYSHITLLMQELTGHIYLCLLRYLTSFPRDAITKGCFVDYHTEPTDACPPAAGRQTTACPLLLPVHFAEPPSSSSSSQQHLLLSAWTEP